MTTARKHLHSAFVYSIRTPSCACSANLRHTSSTPSGIVAWNGMDTAPPPHAHSYGCMASRTEPMRCWSWS